MALKGFEKRLERMVEGTFARIFRSGLRPVELADRSTVWQSYVLTLAPGIQRGRVASQLRAQGIQCNIGTYASHVQPVYGPTEPCPVSASSSAVRSAASGASRSSRRVGMRSW